MTETITSLTTPASNDFIWGKDCSVHGHGDLKIVNNKIYFYQGIDHGSVLNLVTNLETISGNILTQSIITGTPPSPIKLHISSYGGSCFAGFAGMDAIKNCRVPVYTIIDGCAASAGTMLSIVGKKRFMYKNAYMLIHQLSSSMGGKFQELKDEMTNLEKIMDTIRKMYMSYAKIPADKLEEILKHDFWLTADECLSYGLVDEII